MCTTKEHAVQIEVVCTVASKLSTHIWNKCDASTATIPANLNASAEHKICTISDNTIQTKVVCIAASKMPTHTWL